MGAGDMGGGEEGLGGVYIAQELDFGRGLVIDGNSGFGMYACGLLYYVSKHIIQSHYPERAQATT